MRSKALVPLVLLAILGLALALPGPGVAQVKIPPDFAYEKGKDSPGTVTFSHEKHKAKVEKCQGCHTKVFKMKKGTTGPATMEQMKAGAQCGACHDGKIKIADTVVFALAEKANCEKCHKK